MLKKLNFLFIFLFILSCAKTPEEEIYSAKREALFNLSKGKCSKAKDLLDGITPDNDDAAYIAIYASVYECLANYKELDFIQDLGSLDASSGNLFSTLASFSLAQVETTADSNTYSNMMKAINTLISSGGGTQPSHADRLARFGERKAGDLNMQALLLTTLELAKFIKFYSQAGTDGTKGGGSNACLAEYTDANVAAALAGATICNNANGLSRTETEEDNPEYVRRLCEGVILFNNFQDILSNLSFSSNSSELGELVNTAQVLNDIESQILASDATDGFAEIFKDVTGQATCETLAGVAGSNGHKGLQRFFAYIFEGFTE